MNEADLKAKLCAKIREKLAGAVVFRHEDIRSAGIPDISVTWLDRTVWIEAKFAKPKLYLKGLQTIRCRQLAANGKCFFVVWELVKGQQRTLIVLPDEIENIGVVPDERIAPGFDHQFVVDYIVRRTGK